MEPCLQVRGISKTFPGYIRCSIMAALGGVLAASKLQNGQPAAREGYEMFAIASAALGGASLTGGSGPAGRAVSGAAIIAVILDMAQKRKENRVVQKLRFLNKSN
ncbi:MAG: hypothetical protein LBO80_02400 [Treponema sp.]|nr:hypothetical protein [Treponema sp.]